MQFSYIDPSASTKDWIRYKIADTNEAKYFLSDEEILMEMAETASRNKALLSCARVVLAKLALVPDYEIGPEKVKASQAYVDYKNFYAELKANIGSHMAIPTAHISAPQFTIGMFDNV